MLSRGLDYIAGDSPVHRCDARLKIALLFAYSIALFAVGSWWGMGACALLLAGVIAISHLPLGTLNRMLVPVYVMAAFTVLFNAMGTPGLEGLERGLFFAVRMVLLVAASFAVCLTTTSSALLEAFCFIIGPLRRFRVPVDDIALTLALSLRFIPVIEQEFLQIRAAQISRGGQSAGTLYRRLQIWGSAFSALFIGLFRHADALARAMDARCYGASREHT